MDCPRRERLLREWNEAVASLSECVASLAAITGDKGFAEQYQATELARLHAEKTRTMIELHRDDHRC